MLTGNNSGLRCILRLDAMELVSSDGEQEILLLPP